MTPEQAIDIDAFIESIGDKRWHQADVAQVYRFLLLGVDEATFPWGRINRAIKERWSLSGLKRVKRIAWRGLE